MNTQEDAEYATPAQSPMRPTQLVLKTIDDAAHGAAGGAPEKKQQLRRTRPATDEQLAAHGSTYQDDSNSATSSKTSVRHLSIR